MTFIKCVLYVICYLGMASPALAQRLQAAVIGNTSYPAAPLANAARDAATMAESLAQSGFTVQTYINVPASDMEGILNEISAQFINADLGVLYYAGHAFQYEGQNQLLAVDINELTREEINQKVVPLRRLLEATTTAGDQGAGVRLIVIDACRNDPFSAVDTNIQRGIAFEESGNEQTLISYSTSAGHLAYDGPTGGNGPYALAFARALQKPDATVSSILRSVRRDVRITTGGLQIPWVVGSIEEDPLVGRSFEAEELVPRASGELPELDEIIWDFVRSDLTPRTLGEFVHNFPSSRFVPQANQRRREIQESTTATARRLKLVNGAVSSQTLSAIAVADQAALAEAGYEPDTTIPAELFSIWPQELPQTQTGLRTMVTECDVLASDPADPQRMAPPVRGGLVNVRAAARACGYSIARDPENPRFLFQFGRVLELAGRYDWAREYYVRASAYDYSAALTNLGYMAIQGIGQDKDFDAAVEFYRQSAALGNLRARTNIGTMFIKGQGLPKLPEEGVLWYRLASSMGWANAQNALADLYRKGIGVSKDERAAAALYHLAAENGQRAAMNSLGRSYLSGWGVEPDRDTAYLWFDRAIKAGDRFAPRFLARDLVQTGAADTDPERVLNLYRLSADRGFGQAYVDLAKLYQSGKIVPKDAENAYLHARLGQLKKAKGAEELVEKTSKALNQEQIDQIEAEIEKRRRLNGI